MLVGKNAIFLAKLKEYFPISAVLKLLFLQIKENMSVPSSTGLKKNVIENNALFVDKPLKKLKVLKLIN